MPEGEVNATDDLIARARARGAKFSALVGATAGGALDDEMLDIAIKVVQTMTKLVPSEGRRILSYAEGFAEWHDG